MAFFLEKKCYHHYNIAIKAQQYDFLRIFLLLRGT